MLTPPGRWVPRAAGAAAAGVRFAWARTTQVPIPPEPRRMTEAFERSMAASGMRALPTAAVSTGAPVVRTTKLVSRTVFPCEEKASPPEWATRPTAVAGSMAPPVTGKLTRSPARPAPPARQDRGRRMNRDHDVVNYLLGELGPDDRARVERAMRADPAFREEVERLRPVVADLEALPGEAWCTGAAVPPLTQLEERRVRRRLSVGRPMPSLRASPCC